MKRDKIVWLGLIYLVALLVIAIFGPSFRYGYLEQIATPNQDASGVHWFGTDDLGRDVFNRIAFGARISLFIGFVVQAISLSVGITVGVIGEFAPKWLSLPLMRLTDGMFAFPDVLLAILLIGVMGPTAMPGVLPGVRTSATAAHRSVAVNAPTKARRTTPSASRPTWGGATTTRAA